MFVVSFVVAVVVVAAVGQGSLESDSNPGIVVVEEAAGSVVDSVGVVAASEVPIVVSVVSFLLRKPKKSDDSHFERDDI